MKYLYYIALAFICITYACELDSDFDTTISCIDGIQNGGETGVDCGGDCGPCPTCSDGEQNGNETGVDCGGVCDSCPTCSDGEQNGDETGVDCGGSCMPCTFKSFATDGLLGLHLKEVDDGYIVFGYHHIVKYDFLGNEVKSLNVRDFIPGFAFGDFYELATGGFLVIDNAGDYFDMDSDLNFSNVQVYTEFTSSYTGLVTSFGEIAWMGNMPDNSFIGGAPLFPTSPIFLIGNSDYSATYYTFLGGISIPGDVLAKHFQNEDSYYFTSVYNSDFSYSLYGATKSTGWFTDVGSYKIFGITNSPENSEVIVFGGDNSSYSVRAFDKETGNQLSETSVCDSDGGFYGDIITVDEGYLIINIVRELGCSEDQINGFSDISMRLLNFEFESQWETVISLENSEQVHRVLETSDGGYLITGSNRLDSRDVMFLIKTDSLGNVQ